MFLDRVEKKVSSDVWDNLQHEINKLKVGFCDEIITFADSNSCSPETVLKYKELLTTHINLVDIELSILKDTSEIITEIKPDLNIEDGIIELNNIDFHIQKWADEFHLLYLSGFDLFYQMFRYGHIILTKTTKKAYIKKNQVLFSKHNNLTELFEPKKYFDKLIFDLEDSESEEEIISRRKIIESAIKEVLQIDDYKNLLNVDGEIIRTDPFVLFRTIADGFRRSDAKLRLLRKQENNISEEIIELLLLRDRYDSRIQSREELIEALGEEKYNQGLIDDSNRINSLMKELNITKEKVDYLVS